MTVTRRSVLVAGTATPAAGALLSIPAPPAAAEASAGAGGRHSVPLRDGWRFALVDPGGITDPSGAYAQAADPGYDDSAWREVAVPHDWSIEQTPTTDHGTTSGTGFLPGGLGWYRLAFTLPPAYAGRRISVEFDGVYMDSYVYCNGTQAGRHPYGYTGFALDLTGLVHTDGSTPNLLAVKVQNQLPSSRWYSGSGIYREARLVITEPVHVARWGTYVTTPEVSAASARVRVATAVVNESGTGTDVQILSRITGPDGRTVARTSTTVAVADRATETHELTVGKPLLWDFATPEHRYTLHTELRVAGRTTDIFSTPFGIRSYRFDPDEGFSLNGTHTKIKGVDLHHDQGALGAAISIDAVRRQMRIMKSMGVNAFRTSHNPPSPQMIQVCEELGIVMMVEAFDCWRTGKTTYDYGRFFDQWCEKDATEMVLAARNSPAVVLWSIGNEIPDSTSTAGLAMADRIIGAIKAADDTRPVVIGSNKYHGVPAQGSAADLMLAKLDGLGLNYNTAKSVDALHARYPHLFLFESESSSETSTRGTYQEPEHLNTGENHTPGRRETSSYDNNLASWTMSGEYGHKKDRDRKWFAGQFLWSGIDYIGEPTPYNVFPVKTSFFGAVDTAGFPKDMYHLFRSQWTAEPMVHLLPMTWNHEEGDTVEVWAYANVPSVELFLDGMSLGVRQFDVKETTDGRGYLETTEATGDDKTFTDGPYPGSYTSPNGSAGKLHLTWKVPFRPGELKAVARWDGQVGGRHRRAAHGRRRARRTADDRPELPGRGRPFAGLRHRRDRRRARRGGARRRAPHRLRPHRRLPGRGRQRPRGECRALPGEHPHRVPRQGPRHRQVRYEPGPADGHRAGGRPAHRHGERAHHPGGRHRPHPGGRLPARPPVTRELPLPGRQLLRAPGHPARRDARRRSRHRLVQRLRQVGHRAAARVQRRSRRGLGLGRLRAHPDLRPGGGLLHRGLHPCAAREGRGGGVGRARVRPGHGCEGGVGHDLGHPDADHF
ncbi:Beta-galactosidase [Streptomyces sp. RB17]|nr:Beta-galactosidase [Streptomyces sp. RB17]